MYSESFDVRRAMCILWHAPVSYNFGHICVQKSVSGYLRVDNTSCKSSIKFEYTCIE